MDKQELLDGVRDLFLRGEIEAINVFYRLERVMGGSEIEIKLREWEQVKRLAHELGQAQGGNDA